MPRAGHAGHHLEACGLQSGGQDSLGKATAVGHVEVATRHRRTVAVENVKWRDGPGRGDIGRLREFVLGNQGADGLQVWAGDDCKAVIRQDAQELSESNRHLMRVQVLNVKA